MKKKSNILSIVPKLKEKKHRDLEDDSKPFTVREALEQALLRLDDKDSNISSANKLLIISLDDTDDGYYNTSFTQANMKMSECLALIEIMKTEFLYYMGRIK